MRPDFPVNMNFEHAWQLYLKTTDISGVAFDREAVQTVSSLLEVTDYDVLLLDGFGVLNLADTALPGMVNTIDRLRKGGKGAYILTNGASATKNTVVKKYHNFGYSDFDGHSVITSRDALIHGLKNFDGARYWGLSPSQGNNSDLEVRFAPMNTVENWDDFDGFILASTLQWQDSYTERLYATLRRKPRPVLCANPDITAPTEFGFTTEPGYYARQCATILNVEVIFYGKPDLNAYDCALKRIHEDYPNIRNNRILMVGDSPHTDILGGAKAGMQTALMADWGLFAQRNTQELLDEARIYPNWLISNRL